MKQLSIDIETYSSNDLLKCGVYKYVEAEDFEILIFAYSVDNGPVRIVDMYDFDDEIPDEIIQALTEPSIIKTAFNAQFERVCLSRHLGKRLDPRQWRCTMVDGTRLGLPSNLAGIGQALNLDIQKDTAGKALINYFSKPCKATKANGGRTRNLPHHDPEKWEAFKRYCGIDVEVEVQVKQKLETILNIGSKNDQFEQALYAHDQDINDRGVRLDMALVHAAIDGWNTYTGRLKEEAKQLTGLANPNSPAQLKNWLSEQGIEMDSLTKAVVAEKLKEGVPKDVERTLLIRQELGKTSVKKFNAMDVAVCDDDRVRGLLQFYGAGRTGRWAGRLVQVQNLPQNKIKDIELARSICRSGDIEWLEFMYDRVPFVLSQLIRTAFIPEEGNVFAVSDFSAIEARVIAWLAGEKWRLDVFNTHGKIYEASASQMFGIPLEKIDKELRQKGKVSELALGYGGGPNALVTMGALDMGVAEEELQGLVDSWRCANPHVTRLWKDLDNAAKRAIGRGEVVTLQFGLTFFYLKGFLFIQLPSGRRLAYANARLEPHSTFNGKQIVYDGVDGTTKKWQKLHTYGGKLAENVVQAIARDCLAESMIRLAERGYEAQVMHVHDEIIFETEPNSIEKIEAIMGEPIEWAPGLPLSADGFETTFYKKD